MSRVAKVWVLLVEIRHRDLHHLAAAVAVLLPPAAAPVLVDLAAAAALVLAAVGRLAAAALLAQLMAEGEDHGEEIQVRHWREKMKRKTFKL